MPLTQRAAWWTAWPVLTVLLRRALQAVPVLLGAALFTFVLTRVLPGDPAAFLASGPGAGPEAIEAIRHQLGLDRPLYEQLGRYLLDLARGDWGQSFTTGQPVLSDLMQRLPASLELTLLAFGLTLLLGLSLGTAAALGPGTWRDHLCRACCSVGSCLPAFVAGLCLIQLFYVQLGWVPEPIGRFDMVRVPPPPFTGFLLIDTLLSGDLDGWRVAAGHLLLPALAMALFSLAPLARVTRASLLTVLGSEPLRTATALGLPRRQIVLHYALHNALLPIITTLGLVFSYMLGANVVVEKLFAWPGIGSYALDALMASDHAPVQGFVLLVAALFVAVNLGIDLLYGVVDPRTRHLQ